MGGDDVPADWPPLTGTELARVLEIWGMEMTRPLWHSPRPFSAAATVRTVGDGDVLVKRHHRRVRSPAGLEAEHRLARHLRIGGVPAAEILSRRSGPSAWQSAGWTYEVQRVAEGVDRYGETLAWTPYRSRGDAAGAGSALAGFHEAARGFVERAPAAWILTGANPVASASDPLAALAAQLTRRPALGEWLADVDWQTELGPLLDPWPPAPAGELWGHGDWHSTNLSWSGSRVAGIFDLGLAAPTGAEWDVAVALERAMVDWLELDRGATPTIDRPGTQAFLRAYLQHGPLDADAVARSLPLAHVDFALAELEYFLTVTGSAANAELAWDGYLCGHLRWWAGDRGREFLADVHEWADS